MGNSKTVIVIGGPTASGKTDLSLKVAAHFNTSIISADSRQCYKELNIGVAKPSNVALDSIKHYFINSHSIFDTVNAKVFEQYALNAAEEIFAEHDVAVMVGGTGLYINAFCNGLDDIPETDAGLRQQINSNYILNGLEWLQQQVQMKDPLYWQTGEVKNPQRLIRALEVMEKTGKSINIFRQKTKVARPFNVIKFAIEISKEQLHENIDNRVNNMVKDGLEDEVASLINYKVLIALQTVGYKEFFEYFDGRISLAETINSIKQHTRQYAKRQVTWFKKNADYNLILSESDLLNIKASYT